jgi:hypothetical protein
MLTKQQLYHRNIGRGSDPAHRGDHQTGGIFFSTYAEAYEAFTSARKTESAIPVKLTIRKPSLPRPRSLG